MTVLQALKKNSEELKKEIKEDVQSNSEKQSKEMKRIEEQIKKN